MLFCLSMAGGKCLKAVMSGLPFLLSTLNPVLLDSDLRSTEILTCVQRRNYLFYLQWHTCKLAGEDFF